MDITKIEVILRAIELKSFTKAANEYMYSTSAISQMADSLENELGIKIINRQHTGIEVAKGREDIVKALHQIVKAKNQVLKMAMDAKANQNAVTIMTYASISKYILPKVIKEFKAKYSGIDINIIVVDDLQNIGKNYAVDLIFCEQTHSDEFIWEPVLTDPYVAVVPNSFEAQGLEISREQLLENQFIMVKDEIISNYIRKASSSAIVNTSSDDSSVIELVKEGLCVSILPRLTVGNTKIIKTLELNPPFSRTLGFSYREDTFNRKNNVKAFAQFLKDYINNNIKSK